LNGITLTIPPLRARLEEIRPLAEAFARQICRDLGRQPPLLPPRASRTWSRTAGPATSAS
jgi:transcriptional regulator with AAA-type ATPase domain